MEQRNSKYDIVIDALKKYEIYNSLHEETRDQQIEYIYDVILNDAYINIKSVELKGNYYLGEVDLGGYEYISKFCYRTYEIAIYVTNKKHYYPLRINNNSDLNHYVKQKLQLCFDEIIHKQYEPFIKECPYFPNDVKWLICKYI